MLIPGESLHRELELLVAAGLTPKDALATATRNAAQLLAADSLGRIAPGKVADLVVLTANPMTNIRNRAVGRNRDRPRTDDAGGFHPGRLVACDPGPAGARVGALRGVVPGLGAGGATDGRTGGRADGRRRRLVPGPDS